MDRLRPESVAALPAHVATPRYDREALQTGIVHLGIGAFARAHLAAVNEVAIEPTGDLRFGIEGVSMRSADTRDALAPQAGLYTLALRDAAADGRPRERLQVIGNLLGVQVAPEDPGAVVSRIAQAQTRIVSLTVTEKGYCHDPASGALRADHADIVHDLAHADSPRSAIGVLVRGLQRRQRAGLGPITLMSLDNLPSNGDTLRALVLGFAARTDPGACAWIERECTFPNSMVDRIVPRTTAADREAISRSLGVRDAWPVVAEPFLEWAVEDRFVAGRPRWELGGARFVASAKRFEQLKLRMVNASHSALAYLAASAGVATVDAAMALPSMRRYLQRLIIEEIAPSLGEIPGVDLASFGAQLLVRFDNPALAHQTQQIAMDGSQKLPQRLLGSVRERLAHGEPITLLALAVAAWMRYLDGVDDTGYAYPINDPLAPALAQQLANAQALAEAEPANLQTERSRVAALVSFAPVFGDLGDAAGFIDAVAAHRLSIRQHGVLATLVAVARSGGQAA